MEERHIVVGDAICAAWEDKNYELLKDVLANDLEWFEGAFESPQRTADEVVGRWREDVEGQSDITAHIVGVDVVGNVSYQRCEARYRLGSETKNLVGIFRIQLNADDRIIRFEQWWDIQSTRG